MKWIENTRWQDMNHRTKWYFVCRKEETECFPPLLRFLYPHKIAHAIKSWQTNIEKASHCPPGTISHSGNESNVEKRQASPDQEKGVECYRMMPCARFKLWQVIAVDPNLVTSEPVESPTLDIRTRQWFALQRVFVHDWRVCSYQKDADKARFSTKKII